MRSFAGWMRMRQVLRVQLLSPQADDLADVDLVLLAEIEHVPLDALRDELEHGCGSSC